MAVDPLGAFIGLALTFFLPGFALLHALFPGRRYFGPFHPFAMPALSAVLSIAVTVVAGSILGAFGAFQKLPLELTLGGVALAALAVGWWRGAFPLLGRTAEYPNVSERGEPEEVTMLRDMRLEEERLRKEAARVRRRATQSRDPGVRSALDAAATDLERDRKDLERRAKDVEHKAGSRRYGTAGTRGPRPRP